MAVQGHRPKFRIRVLDPVSGVELINALQHTYCEFTKLALQPGWEASASVGTGKIGLYPPSSARYKLNKPDYDRIDYTERVEIYFIDGNETAGAIGSLAYAATITRIDSDYDSYTLTIEDSLGLAKEDHSELTETFSGTTDQLLRLALKSYALTYGDGDTNDVPWDLSQYTNDGGWTVGVDEGYPVVIAAGSGDGQLLTTRVFTNSEMADVVFGASYRLSCDSASLAVAEAGIVAAASNVSNVILGRGYLRQVTATAYLIDFQILQRISGQYYMRTNIGGILVPVETNVIRCDVRLIGKQLSSTIYRWRVIINDTDPNCFWDQTVTAGNPTGSAGLRSWKGAAAAGEQAYCDQFAVLSRQNIFQPGAITVGATNVAQTISFNPPLTMMEQAITTEGFYVRVNYKPGLNQDTVDFAAAPGADLSSTVWFRTPDNLLNPQLSANDEPFATSIVLQGHSAPDGQGTHHRIHIAQAKKHGLRHHIVSAPNISSRLSLKKTATEVLKRASRSNNSAKQLTVVRDLSYASASSPTGLLFRELDTIMISAPEHYINKVPALVMGYTIRENDPTMDLVLDQHPFGTLGQLKRYQRAAGTAM